MGPHGVALEHHADAALFRGDEGFAAGHQLIVDVQFAGGGLFKARDDAQHGGFAAAGGAQEGDEFSVAKGFVKLFEHHVIAKGLGDVFNRYSCHRYRSFLRWRIRPW